MKKLIVIILFMTLFSACSNAPKQNSLTFVTFDEEMSLGKQMVIESTRRFKLIRNMKINDFVNRLAKKIGLVSDWDGLTYTVYVINEPDVCHFSLPGGHVYLFRGILDQAENTAQIAGIIAHEIAHIAHRHGVDRLSQKYAYALAAQSVIGENPEIASHLIRNLYTKTTILDYPKEHEFLADKKAIQYCWKANYDPAEYGRFIRKFYLLAAEQPENFRLLLSTHPDTRERYQFIRKELKDVPEKQSLEKGLNEFKEIKSLVQQIPY